MQKFKRDFFSWCTECNQEKKDKQDKLLSEYETTEMEECGSDINICHLASNTAPPVQAVLANCYYQGYHFLHHLNGRGTLERREGKVTA
ncbi:hypothetical protein TSUD_73320 [Trifolium subterraneum]|uniref:Uncharacterized protein n=1 Tax=Trifolium subterraneum TaxID=3900 RepID=A0A2Z6M2I7_TRISU|nr:hypothetical protein TSUD_73320 [Trifolium subterraneum]